MERAAIMFNFQKDYMEFFFIIVMILGTFLALLAPSSMIRYVMAFIAGFCSGRVIFERKGKIKFPQVVIIMGFFIGYVLVGAYLGSGKFIAALFIVGSIVGYKIFDKGLISDIRA